MNRKTTRKPAIRRDVCQDVTNAVIEAIEAGARPWSCPWDAGNLPVHPLRHNGQSYRGINIILLWMTAAARGYGSPFWMSYRQAQTLGGQVRKGEKSTTVVYYGTTRVKDRQGNASGGEETDDDGRPVRFLKSYAVFNADQIDGLPAHFYNRPAAIIPAADRIDELDAFLSHTGADIRHGGNRAFYALQPDYIQLPPFETFTDAERYYATAAHELAHWTRHPSRLDRDFGRKRMGDEGYAKEELVAELASAFLGATFGFRPDHIEDHAAYIASWLSVLRNDKRFIFAAAARAQEAADYLLERAGWMTAAVDEDDTVMDRAA